MEAISKSKNTNIMKAAEIFGEDGIDELDRLIGELEKAKTQDGSGDERHKKSRNYENYEPIYDLKG
jgi:hypothetical protein